ncbi:MAG: glycoside hydrolase family 13 protein [Lachnospiraceae bacterium]|nr:glycoside hydrolase family 13 protein [Lachnospiraceae bacterium]
MNKESIFDENSSHKYLTEMRPVFNKKALFSDTTENYISPAQPSPYARVKIRFRSAKNNIDRVYCIFNGFRQMMLKADTDELFDYYEVQLQLDDEKVTYYFEVQEGKIVCYYDRRGVVKTLDAHYRFVIIPGFRTPDWAKGAVMYQIYVDRFYNGDPGNDVLTDEYTYIGEHTTHVDQWDKYPAEMGVREFYGGDLQGVLDKLDYLQDLGVDAIYFNPLFVSPSNHKYDIQDYDYIDPHVGRIVSDKGDLLQPGQMENRFASRYIDRVTNKENLEASNAFFAEVVGQIHKRGMKVILDGVFNHCGSFNKWMDKERIYENADGYSKGAYVDGNSPYRKYFQWHNENSWPYNNSYDGWWGHDTLPKLNYEGSNELYEYILHIARKWVSPPYNVDGWRLDVAADLGHSPEMNHRFWRDFRNAVKQANPEAVVLAEHYGDPSAWLQGDQWDTIMNYDAFMEPITWFLTGMQKHSDDFRLDLLGNANAFWDSMYYHATNMATPSLYTSMNELSNHDHSRFLTRTNKKVGRVNSVGSEAANQGVNKAVMREAVLMQMTWPGAPTIYYGDEAGVCGFTDPDNRRTYPWGNEDEALIDYHRKLIRIHKSNSEFLTGSIKEMYRDYNVLGYARFNRNSQSIILVNNGDSDYTLKLNVWTVGVPKDCILQRLIMTTEDGYEVNGREQVVVSGQLSIILPKTSAMILQYRKKEQKKFLHFI